MVIYSKTTYKGGGYSYWVFSTEGKAAHTLKGCPDNQSKEEFVSKASELIPYNGRMPMVIYVPEDCQVNYKIYQSSNEIFKAAVSKPGK